MISRNYHFGFIGLGLIGGSIARALKIHFPDCTITAASRSRAPLQAALEDGNIDIITTSIDAASFGCCDYIFLCTPVQYISVYLNQLRNIINPSCTITDVGSVKGCVHETVTGLGMEANFIGGHPMAGSEKTGYANSSALLLENAYYAITPTISTSEQRLNEYVDLVKTIGAIPVVTDCITHDYSVAGISHLPHLIAGSLVNLIQQSDNEDNMMKRLAAGGFKDITRIASSSPEMWEQICMTNTDAILSLLDDYIEELKEIRSNLNSHTEGYIYRLFERSSEYRNSISDNSRGPVTSSFCLNCDLEDKEGAIAHVATLLAESGISIKNIGIVHNREFKQGALVIEFYDKQSLEGAAALLKANKYSLY